MTVKIGGKIMFELFDLMQKDFKEFYESADKFIITYKSRIQ